MTVISTREQVPQILRSPGAPGLPRPAAAPAGMSGQDILRILLKRKWLIVLSFLICLVFTIAGTALWMNYWPSYTATAYLVVNPPEWTYAGPVERGGEAVDRMKMSVARMAKREPVLQKVVLDPEVKKTRWYQEHLRDPVASLEAATRYDTVRETDLLGISLTGGNPDDLPPIVRAWANAVVTDVVDSANKNRDDQIKNLEDRQRGYKGELDEVDRQIKDTKPSDDRVIQQALASKTSELVTLTEAAMKAKLELDTAERQKAMIEEMDRAGQIENHPQVQQFLDNDPLLRSLIQAKVDAEMARQSLGEKFPPGYRVMTDLISRIESLERQIAEREASLRKTAVLLLRDSYNRQYDMLKAQRDALEERRRQLDSEVMVLNANLKTVMDQQGKRRSLENRMEELERRLLELRLLRQGAAPVYVRAWAAKPTKPSWPRWEVFIPLGSVVGLLVGLGLAFLLELMDTSIRNPTDVSRRVDLPLLGVVPHVGDLDEEIQDLRLAFMTNPNSLFGEAFRQIRTTLQFSAPAAQLRTLLVTSAMPGDGRSTVALNLAAATAHGGRRVVVVEANFRQPMLRTLFPQAPAGGLANVLVGQANWKDLVREVHPNLFVLCGGPLPPNPAELLGSDAMRSLVVELAAEYDQVVFDGAPCLLVTDAVVLATLVDGVVLVVRAASNTYGVVQRARDILSRVGARLFGVVLNGIRVTAGGYLRKNYRTFYEYHSQADTPAPTQQLPK